MARRKRETEESLRKLWYRFWDLQDQTNKIKEAVLTGEKGDLKMPEKRELTPGEPIPFGGAVDVNCIFPQDSCEQAEAELARKEALRWLRYMHYVNLLSVLMAILTVALIFLIMVLLV